MALLLELDYKNEKVQDQCTSVKAAAKLFGGNHELAVSLHSRINALKNADTLRDIIMQPKFRFHNLHGDREGYFAIDVKTKREPWRIVLQPLDDNRLPFNPCHIDEISGTVRVVKITEVSNHYE